MIVVIDLINSLKNLRLFKISIMWMWVSYINQVDSIEQYRPIFTNFQFKINIEIIALKIVSNTGTTSLKY